MDTRRVLTTSIFIISFICNTHATDLIVKPGAYAIEKALQQADLGVTPMNDGKLIRITFPPMTEDRRKMLSKTISKMSEDYKVSVRNERRDAIEKVKKAQKAGEVTEDDLKRYEADIQKATDASVALIEKITAEKEKEIMTI